MDTKKILALVGAVVLIVGLFLPIMTLPGMGSVNLFMPGGNISGDGIALLVLAVIAAGLALAGYVKHVVWPALPALCLVGYEFFDVKGKLDAAQESINSQISQLGDAAATAYGDVTLQMGWLGWAALGVGAVLMLVAGIMGWMGGSAPKPTV